MAQARYQRPRVQPQTLNRNDRKLCVPIQEVGKHNWRSFLFKCWLQNSSEFAKKAANVKYEAFFDNQTGPRRANFSNPYKDRRLHLYRVNGQPADTFSCRPAPAWLRSIARAAGKQVGEAEDYFNAQNVLLYNHAQKIQVHKDAGGAGGLSQSPGSKVATVTLQGAGIFRQVSDGRNLALKGGRIGHGATVDFRALHGQEFARTLLLQAGDLFVLDPDDDHKSLHGAGPAAGYDGSQHDRIVIVLRRLMYEQRFRFSRKTGRIHRNDLGVVRRRAQ